MHAAAMWWQYLVGYLKSKLPSRIKHRVLTFDKPRPDAGAAVFNFNGVMLGYSFFGRVTRQEAQLAPVERKRIITP